MRKNITPDFTTNSGTVIKTPEKYSKLCPLLGSKRRELQEKQDSLPFKMLNQKPESLYSNYNPQTIKSLGYLCIYNLTKKSTYAVNNKRLQFEQGNV